MQIMRKTYSYYSLTLAHGLNSIHGLNSYQKGLNPQANSH
jgi:hypothetical protein